MNRNILVYDKKPADFSPLVEIAAIYLQVEAKLLLLEISAQKQETGKWGVPAGKIERGERPVEGAKRELFEETGIHVASEESFYPVGTLYMRRPEIEYTYHLFGLQLESMPPICLSYEHSSYTWASRQEIEKLPLMIGAKPTLDLYYQRTKKKDLF